MSTMKLILVALGTIFFFATFIGFPLVIYLQERKNFAKINGWRVAAYGLAWILYGLWDFLWIAALMPFSDEETTRQRAAQSCTGNAKFNYLLFHKRPIVEGAENLPKKSEGIIYVANHQSMMDVAAFYFIEREFAWVSKDTVFLAPGVGWLMKLAKYVPIKRTNEVSKKELYRLCKDRLDNDIGIAIFPQGTRSRKEVLKFKNGAFKLAVDNKTKICPITIILPDDLWLPGCKEAARLIVHPMISGTDVDELREKAFKVVTEPLSSKND